jgi:hypothetical protein
MSQNISKLTYILQNVSPDPPHKPLRPAFPIWLNDTAIHPIVQAQILGVTNGMEVRRYLLYCLCSLVACPESFLKAQHRHTLEIAWVQFQTTTAI